MNYLKNNNFAVFKYEALYHVYVLDIQLFNSQDQ